VQQAPLLDGLALDAFALQQDGLPSAVIDIGRREVLQALVVALVVVVFGEGLDLRFKVAGQVVVLQHNPDLVLGRVVLAGHSTDVTHHPLKRDQPPRGDPSKMSVHGRLGRG
jgi:hypothetical protein